MTLAGGINRRDDFFIARHFPCCCSEQALAPSVEVLAVSLNSFLSRYFPERILRDESYRFPDP